MFNQNALFIKRLYTITVPIILLMLVTLFSCTVKRKIISETASKDISPKIAFLNYIISKDENGRKHIEFISKKITEGKLRNYTNHSLKEAHVGDIKFTQLNKDSIEVNHTIIKNPLLEIIEYVNDSLIFEKKTIELNKAHISVRLQLNRETTSVTVSEILDSLYNNRPLITTKLD